VIPDPREPADEPQMTDDERVVEEEAAAAREAGSIGGRRDEGIDEAERAVFEAGGGEAEGFEQAEEELRDQAEYGEGHNPLAEAGEAESDYSDAEYGEPDRLGSTARPEEQGEVERDRESE
jgi:hypothetical protein